MTTAARPTFDPARGNDSKAPTFQYSSRDLSAHTKLKYRQTGQLTQDELENVDLKEELLKAEKEHFENKLHSEKKHSNDEDDNSEDQLIKRRKLLLDSTTQLDADDDSDGKDSDDDSDESEEEEEEDDTAALLAELDKIKKERAEERERQELEKFKERQEEIMTGNPLIANKDFNVRRRWDDDVIFKNQARGVEDNPKKRFINDTLRSDFHRKFMNKYVK